MSKPLTRLRFIPKEPPRRPTPGESAYAIRSPKPWDGKDRTAQIWGVVVHTTGSGLPSRALEQGIYPTVAATQYYQRSHGTHYVMGWKGLDGDLIQVANERERANGVGMRDQKASVAAGWTKDLPAAFVRRWRAWWVSQDSPLDLFPGTWANNVYIHVEQPPCVFYHKGKLTEAAPPMRPGLRFTRAQHDGIARLACDIARRYSFPDRWWTHGRIVGHEDLSPITRTNRGGGWDPGWHRAKPFFDFRYVISQITHMELK